MNAPAKKQADEQDDAPKAATTSAEPEPTTEETVVEEQVPAPVPEDQVLPSDPEPDDGEDPDDVAPPGGVALNEELKGDNALDSDNEAYVGIDPQYANHANDTEKPYDGEEGGDDEALNDAVKTEKVAKKRSKDMDERPKPGVTGY